MARKIKPVSAHYVQASLDLIENVFTAWRDPQEGRTVRALTEEIRSGEYYVPELELVMTDEADRVIGYVMFSRFHLEGKYGDRLLLLAPVAVRTDLQRQHISKELIEYGFRRAEELGFEAVIVEGDPRNYNPRGFETSSRRGIVAGPGIDLPSEDCLMVKELFPGALEHISGVVDYSFYQTLT